MRFARPIRVKGRQTLQAAVLLTKDSLVAEAALGAGNAIILKILVEVFHLLPYHPCEPSKVLTVINPKVMNISSLAFAKHHSSSLLAVKASPPSRGGI